MFHFSFIKALKPFYDGQGEAAHDLHYKILVRTPGITNVSSSWGLGIRNKYLEPHQIFKISPK